MAATAPRIRATGLERLEAPFGALVAEADGPDEVEDGSLVVEILVLKELLVVVELENPLGLAVGSDARLEIFPEADALTTAWLGLALPEGDTTATDEATPVPPDTEKGPK